jgi:hypothetical protein
MPFGYCVLRAYAIAGWGERANPSDFHADFAGVRSSHQPAGLSDSIRGLTPLQRGRAQCMKHVLPLGKQSAFGERQIVRTNGRW